MTYMLPNASDMAHLPSWYGFITTPGGGLRPIRDGRPWCLDNGAFTGRFHPDTFRRALRRLAPYASTCRFVAAPDVIGDADATLARWPAWRDEIRSHGYPAALVGQDGLTVDTLPIDIDALFIGGSNDWRASRDVADLIRVARERGAWVHVGRVNSARAIRRWSLLGADSVDGTCSVFAGMDGAVARFDLALSETPLWRGIP